MSNIPIVPVADNRPFYKKKRFIIPGALLLMAFIGSQLPEPPTTADTIAANNHSTQQTGDAALDSITVMRNFIKGLDQDDMTKNGLETAMDFTLTMAIYKVYAQKIAEGKASGNKTLVALAGQLEQKVIVSQKKNLPKIRKAFYEMMKKKLWEEDVYVNISGSDYTTLQFTGAFFAANKNIATTQSTLQEMLTLLRFKHTQYRWYRGQDEYTYYTIDSPSDAAIEA